MSSSVSTCIFIAIIVTMFLMTVYAVPEDPELYEGDVKSSETNKRPSFYTGSRYGRSGPSIGGEHGQDGKRNDKFFLGSRYGKRTQVMEEDERVFTCLYTGFKDFFRCN